jgi:TrpR-related protein YerC/YecD
MKPNRQDSDRQQARNEDALFRAIVSLQDTRECGNFLRDLCTPAELQALVDRWQVVKLLQEGLPYRRIHDLTGVSVTTIGRVARFLTDGFGGYQAALDRTGAAKPRRSH